MPWNDNVKPGPWGAPPEGSGGDDDGRPEGGGARPGAEGGPGPRSPWGASPPPAGGAEPSGPRVGRPATPGAGPRRRPERPKLTPLGAGGGSERSKEFEALQREWSERARRFFRHPNGRGVRPGAVAVIVGAAVGLWALTGVYIVQPNEQAVVTRFGVYARTESPGLKVRLPWPVEHAQTVPVTTLNQLAIGGAGATDRPEESLMLTGDENIVQMTFAVLWRVSDADNYLFRVSDPEGSVEMVAESAMREVVGRTPFQSVVSTGRGQVQTQAAELMQSILDQYGAGVNIVEVQIVGAEPPREVIDAFRDVARAGQNAEASVNEANTYRNRVVNEAIGDAAAIRQQAEGYRERVAREAEGSAARFNQVYSEYRAAPGVTRERLYLETMERVLRDSNKVVVDSQGGASAPIILPPEVFRGNNARALPAQPQPQAQPQTGAAAGAAR
ncbi:MAG: FtsH protease activity modulator HflK [Proteobacteria bacterium]|nr:FtsH protease activity modulator HflK [Pseudomonadota bacterium]